MGWIKVNVGTYRDNASPCAVGVLCLAVTGVLVPKSILPMFRESGRRLREEFSGGCRDHEGLCCDVLSWVIWKFSTDLLEGLMY